MDNTLKNLVKNYVDAQDETLTKAYYVVRIWLTGNTVQNALYQYMDELSAALPEIEDFARDEQDSEQQVGCNPKVYRPILPNRVKVERNGYVTTVDENDLDATDIILAYYVYNSLSGTYDTPDILEPSTGFGGGGDFGGGGAGGSYNSDSY